ncbi:MAG: hypothetical protein FWF42_03870 [Streptococcaceae bacterium]|nr:hypothetical protein [Streptococcaceae bacterium]
MPNKKINVQLEKHLELPTVLVRLHGDTAFGFSFLIDASVKYNLLDRCFLEEWVVQTPPTEEELAAPAFLEDGSYNWNHRDTVMPIHQDKGKKRVICKDGVRRVCDMIKLDFAIQGRDGIEKYSELFAIDPSMCQYFHEEEQTTVGVIAKNKTIAGVLGNDFLKEQKWILNNSAM